MFEILERPAAYTINGFPQQLTISRGTVYNMVKDGRLRLVKIGGRSVIPASELDRPLAVDEGE